MEFLRKHYEKIVLCLVLLGLAAAAVWAHKAIGNIPEPPPVASDTPSPAPRRTRGGGAAAAQAAAATIPPIDLSTDMISLAQITNPPEINLSGEHNLFDPVTWKRKSDGTLMKIIKIGPNALVVTNITKLYTIISYDHPSGSGSDVYVMAVQQHSDPARPARKVQEFAKKDQKTKSGLYEIKDVKGDADDPSELDLELTGSQQRVTVTKDKPYEWVDSCTADLRYEPDSRTYLKMHAGDPLTLDGEPYKIVEITTNAVRIQFNRTTKVTEIKWK
jgi:hypothetical protein